MGAEGAGEHRPVDACDRVDAEVAHHAREQDADRCRRSRVRVREPEVKRDRRRLDQEPDDQEDKRRDEQAVGFFAGKRATDLSEIERARASVHERDAEEHQHRSDRIRDGEVERTLERAFVLHAVADERERGRAHQLEEDEHVEEVAREGESDGCAEEQQHEDVEERSHLLEIAPRVRERREDEQGREQSEAGADRVDDE